MTENSRTQGGSQGVASKRDSYSGGSTSLSPVATQLLNSLPLDGSSKGNIKLRRYLNLSRTEYERAKHELLDHGLVVTARGQGGSLSRSQMGASLTGDNYRTTTTANMSEKQEEPPNNPASSKSATLEADNLVLAESEGDGEDGNQENSFDNSADRRIFSDKSDPSVSDLYNRYKEGDLILQPDFQRQFVWDRKKCSRLVESAVLEVPLPMIYLSEEQDGHEAVIDGQQRLAAFFRFLDGEYALSRMSVLRELNGMHFENLSRDIQNKIKKCSIRATTIKKESSENLKFEIFERLNTGAVSLNDQELRNCIFRGPYNDLLKELSTDAEFREIIRIKNVERRMRDVELVLRFAAFYHASYLNYTSPMRRFLNEDMKKYQNISDKNAKELKKAFKNAVHLAKSLFGKQAFRRFYRGTDPDSPSGAWESKTFSSSLYDVLMCTLARHDKNTAYRHLDAIREEFIDCMTLDDDFIETIERGTSATTMIRRRFEIWRNRLKQIVDTEGSGEQRFFSYDLKRQLYEQNPVCSICRQTIQEIDDAAVDHVEQYSQGGKTVPENARLTHRYCNWSRSRKE